MIEDASTITALLFDMDGLLLDTERLSYRSWESAATEFGYKLPLEVFKKMIGKPVAENEPLVKSFLGSSFPYWEVRARRVEIFDEIVGLDGIPVKHGVKPLLDKVAAHPIRSGVVTSTATVSAKQRLTHGDLLRYFEFVLGPEEVEKGKPEPDCYLLAAQRMNVEPKNCIVLEDSPAGVEAAHRAGMNVCWVPDLVEVTSSLEAMSQIVCSNLEEAHEIFVSLGILPNN